MIESNLEFTFDNSFKVIKFDDTDIYKKYQNGITNGKGVDFIAYSNDKVILMENKNCTGYEADNKRRTHLGTYEKEDGTIDDCFDLEVAKKVSCTLSCITGAGTFPTNNRNNDYEELSQILKRLIDSNHTIEVILFLEGNFGSKTRRKKMIMESIQKRLKRHFKGWINISNCRVIDSSVKINGVSYTVLQNN